MFIGLKFAALATAAFVAGSAQTNQPLSDEVLRALDPTRTMMEACGGGRTRGETLRQRLALAANLARGEMVASVSDAVPLYEGLGAIGYPVSTRSEMAQRYFNQGLAFVYGFNHAEAIRAFREAQRIDPDCAMCWWGEALAHGPNINAPMDPEANARAMEAMQRAVALKGGARPVEQGLIDAVAVRYASDPKANRAALDRAYADATLKLTTLFPQDDEVAVLAAEAVMDTRPWDYWEADRVTPKGEIATAMKLVEGVLARNPDHPQAIHLYIHLVESTLDPKRAESFADRLAKPLVPNAGHLVHMPGHLYYVIGRFKDAIRVNVDAARVDEAYLKTSADQGFYRFGYYPHNVHFIVASAQMAGDMKTAITESRRLSRILNTEITAALPWVQPVDAAPYLAYAQFATPKQILALSPPDARLPYVTAMWRYARAVAHAHNRDDKRFAQEIAAIRHIRDTTDFKPMTDQLVPAPELLRLAETVAQARLDFAHKRYARAADRYREAVKIEDQVRYMEPPFWYYPVRQSLGAALYRSGDMAGAQQAFTEALAQWPGNGWALYGLAMAQRAQGDRMGAAASEAALDRAWAGDRRWLTLDRL